MEFPYARYSGTSIHTVRSTEVVLDGDLARLYGAPPFRLNEAVKRNVDRFPNDFCFQLIRDEFAHLISQFAISSGTHGGRRKLPWAFTEHGWSLASVF
jgi:hypothetical protein